MSYYDYKDRHRHSSQRAFWAGFGRGKKYQAKTRSRYRDALSATVESVLRCVQIVIMVAAMVAIARALDILIALH